MPKPQNDDQSEILCRTCRYFGYEPDVDFFCTNKIYGTFGRTLAGPNNPRSIKGKCGPDGKLYEERKT